MVITITRITSGAPMFQLGLPSMGLESPDQCLEGLWVVLIQKQGYWWSGQPRFLLVVYFSRLALAGWHHHGRQHPRSPGRVHAVQVMPLLLHSTGGHSPPLVSHHG